MTTEELKAEWAEASKEPEDKESPGDWCFRREEIEHFALKHMDKLIAIYEAAYDMSLHATKIEPAFYWEHLDKALDDLDELLGEKND